jgi:predicted nuclease of restriction endonuclease-like (RecB) superfamily
MKPVQEISFDDTVSNIFRVDAELRFQAAQAVNVSLPLRNWLIGFYIAHFELRGADRAQYGEKLLERLSERLMSAGVSRAEMRELRRYKQFYTVYPGIASVIPATLQVQLSEQFPIRDSVSPESRVSAQDIITKLSFTHLVALLGIEDDLKRAFYELECIRGHWSVRELKRQISSLLVERTALSGNTSKVVSTARRNAEQQRPQLEVRDPYVFEFLGIRPDESVTETSLERGLLEKIESFILELGNGFCFEARQKRILIGDQTYFVDLVFYHRILKCHVLIELKLGAFTHEHIGQLNTYVTWYKRHMMIEGDHPPVGILLCGQKDHTLVEYALEGLGNDLFVSKFLLELPKEALQRVIELHLKEQP